MKRSVFLRSWAVIDVTVRREKALDFSGCNSRPGTGSLHPVDRMRYAQKLQAASHGTSKEYKE